MHYAAFCPLHCFKTLLKLGYFLCRFQLLYSLPFSAATFHSRKIFRAAEGAVLSEDPVLVARLQPTPPSTALCLQEEIGRQHQCYQAFISALHKGAGNQRSKLLKAHRHGKEMTASFKWYLLPDQKQEDKNSEARLGETNIPSFCCVARLRLRYSRVRCCSGRQNRRGGCCAQPGYSTAPSQPAAAGAFL